MKHILLVLLFCILLPGSATAQSRAIALHPENPEQTRVGRLIYRGGVVMRFADKRFGGISGIDLEPGGATLIAVTDEGNWAKLHLDYDGAGNLSGAELISMEALTGRGGATLRNKSEADAEELVRLTDGAHVVIFERRSRIIRYPAARAPFAARGQGLSLPPGAERLRSNRGIEAAAALDDGKMLLIAEDLPTLPGHTFAWIGKGLNDWIPMSYTLYPPFRPTGAARLPDGDIVVVERRASAATGVGARIVRIDTRRIRPGAPISGRELARLEPPFTVDNFEAIAARRGDGGETLIYLASDDNFSPAQHNLLMMFEVLP